MRTKRPEIRLQQQRPTHRSRPARVSMVSTAAAAAAAVQPANTIVVSMANCAIARNIFMKGKRVDKEVTHDTIHYTQLLGFLSAGRVSVYSCAATQYCSVRQSQLLSMLAIAHWHTIMTALKHVSTDTRTNMEPQHRRRTTRQSINEILHASSC